MRSSAGAGAGVWSPGSLIVLTFIACGQGVSDSETQAAQVLVDSGGQAAVPATPVPALPPDSMPTSLVEGFKPVEDAYGGFILTSLLVVEFSRDATQEQKQAAIDRIDGRVVGGVRSGSGGMYLVHVVGDSTIATADSIAGVLDELPSVDVAYPETFFVLGPGLEPVPPPLPSDTVPSSR